MAILFNKVLRVIIAGLCMWMGCHTTKRPIIKVSERASKQISAFNQLSEQIILMPGQVSLVKFPYHGPFKDESLLCNGHAIPFVTSPTEQLAIAYVARSYFDLDETYTCDFQFRDSHENADVKRFSIGQIVTKNFPYPEEQLNVDYKKIVLSLEDKKRSENETNMLNEIYKNANDTILFTEPFRAPLRSKITSIFGTKRIFNQKVATQHLGTDFRAKIGTTILPSNSGRVVFVGDLFFGGNTVILSHGLGIFTTYSHLSEIKVALGQKVTKETILGYSGMTGRVSGPHLHWGAKVHGHWVDGDSLVKSSAYLSVMAKKISQKPTVE